MEENLIYSGCHSCGQSTKHHIRARYDRNNSREIDKSLEESSSPSEIMFVKNYLTLECCGCETISFRLYEKYFILTGNEEENIPSYIDYNIIDLTYPSIKYNELRTKSIQSVPENLLFVYREIIDSYNFKTQLLCASGLRVIVEAICNDMNVKGKNLTEKIENLSKLGNVLSNKTSESLKGLKFIGNEALHKLVVPSEEELKIGIEIIEHVLKELYEIPYQKKRFDEIATRRVSN
jgi:hypothetical protein